MGELLLCHETIAALPYYIEETGINIYSMEELSYYISGNVYLLDHSFMCESSSMEYMFIPVSSI